MSKLIDPEKLFIGLIFEGLLYGFYSGIFAMYLQLEYQASEKKDTNKNIVFYSICALYVLSVALCAADMTLIYWQFFNKPIVSELHIYFIVITLFGCCDFIAQSILIYRCWIVWGCNIRVVIIPSILALAFLGIWLAGGSSRHISSDKFATPHWGYLMSLSGLVLSLTVNTLVMGLIVFRIFKVFRQVRTTSNDPILGAAGSKLRRIILVLIESGMALFSVQLLRVGFGILYKDILGISAITRIHNVINGITPTIIAVRISMGLSFHDEKSMEEVAMGSLDFAFNHPNSGMETSSINIVGEDGGRRDDIGIQRSNNIVGEDGMHDDTRSNNIDIIER